MQSNLSKSSGEHAAPPPGASTAELHAKATITRKAESAPTSRQKKAGTPVPTKAQAAPVPARRSTGEERRWQPQSSVSLRELVPPPPPNVNGESRSHRLFDWYPLQDAVSIDKRWYPTPLHVYQGQVSLILGLFDENARSLPPAAIRDSQGRALAQLCINAQEDTSIGPDNSLVLFCLVGAGGDPLAAQGARLEWDLKKEPFRAVQALVNPDYGLYKLHWVVSRQAVAQYVGQVFNTSTTRATVVIDRRVDGARQFRHFHGLTENGSLIVDGQLRDYDGDEERGLQFAELMRTLGWEQSIDAVVRSQLGLPPTVGSIFGRSNIDPATSSRITARTNFDPTYRLWNPRGGDYLRVEAGGVLGNAMNERGFDPLVCGHHRDLKAVFEASQPNDPTVGGLVSQIAETSGLVPDGEAWTTANRRVRVWAHRTEAQVSASFDGEPLWSFYLGSGDRLIERNTHKELHQALAELSKLAR